MCMHIQHPIRFSWGSFILAIFIMLVISGLLTVLHP
jgi:hypothetical protein